MAGAGGLYLWNGQLDRTEHAYRMAEEKADDVALTVMARRGLARRLRLRGHLDEAAKERNDGVWQTLKDHAEGMINRDTARLVQSGKNETPHQAGSFLEPRVRVELTTY